MLTDLQLKLKTHQTSHISSATLFKAGADGQRQHPSLPSGGCARAWMDDEIFQGVSFAAVKEQLQLLGHDLPDDVILAYLTEDSPPPHQPQAGACAEASCSAAGCRSDAHARASAERCQPVPGEGGRSLPWSAAGGTEASCSSQSHRGVDQHPCSGAGSASASDLDGTRAREAYDEEQLLSLLRLSEVGRPARVIGLARRRSVPGADALYNKMAVAAAPGTPPASQLRVHEAATCAQADGAYTADSLAELGRADWSSYERADCAATLHVSARCAGRRRLSPACFGVCSLSDRRCCTMRTCSLRRRGGPALLRLPGTSARALGALLWQVRAVASGAAAAAQRSAAAGEGAGSAQQPRAQAASCRTCCG